MASSTAKGVFWSAIDRFGVVLLQFVINLVLARLLTPNDFGLVGMILIFVVVSQTLIDSGFGSALIQKLHPTQTDYSTVFWWNLMFSIFLYAIIYVLNKLWKANFKSHSMVQYNSFLHLLMFFSANNSTILKCKCFMKPSSLFLLII